MHTLGSQPFMFAASSDFIETRRRQISVVRGRELSLCEWRIPVSPQSAKLFRFPEIVKANANCKIRR